MGDNYLWDGSGEPDPEVGRLERLLTQFRSERPAPEFPERKYSEKGWRRPLRWTEALRPYWVRRLAVVVATAVVLVGVWLALHRAKPVGTAPPGWQVASLAGAPRIGASRIGNTGRFRVGQVLETDAASRASISMGEIGQVEVEVSTRLRLVEARDSRGRLALDRGTIRAAIWAPPGQFIVDTPSAVAVDLGCAYTLTVDDSGAGLVRTTLGWVGFRLDGRESFIPAGAVCATRPGIGPGTPYFDDASEPFRLALAKLDFDREGPELQETQLRLVLSEARPRDVLTLWHLLTRLGRRDRAWVYDRLAALVAPPTGVTRDGVLGGDRQMLDLWWNRLGLGDTSLWRTFERSWPQDSK